VRAVDAETGEAAWVDSSDRRLLDHYARWWREQSEQRQRLFRRSGVDSIDIRIDQSYVNPLVAFFRVREKRW
jgi:uncharacterized protein (DUF58 family)